VNEPASEPSALPNDQHPETTAITAGRTYPGRSLAPLWDDDPFRTVNVGRYAVTGA